MQAAARTEKAAVDELLAKIRADDERETASKIASREQTRVSSRNPLLATLHGTQPNGSVMFAVGSAVWRSAAALSSAAPPS